MTTEGQAARPVCRRACRYIERWIQVRTPAIFQAQDCGARLAVSSGRLAHPSADRVIDSFPDPSAAPRPEIMIDRAPRWQNTRGHRTTLFAKYHVQFSIPLEHRRLVNDFRTDDPVECEEFIADLLLRGYKINSLVHDGAPLSRSEFDSAVKRRFTFCTKRKPI